MGNQPLEHPVKRSGTTQNAPFFSCLAYRQVATKPILRPSRPRSAPTFLVRVRRRLAALGCLRRSAGCVNFRSSVRVLTFARSLCGGDAVPTDGSLVALGLADTPVESQVALAPGPREASDQISWMPTEMRERVLEHAMGAESFRRARDLQLPEMTQVVGQRKDTAQDGKDVSLMPQSWEEARRRAESLSEEVAGLALERRRLKALAGLLAPRSPASEASWETSARWRVWPRKCRSKKQAPAVAKGARKRACKVKALKPRTFARSGTLLP
ncbi:unnamed protein product [Effrenium voratum]|nr:unnamed protein product [Effrenium voratum]